MKIRDRAGLWVSYFFTPSKLTRVKLFWAFSSSVALIVGGCFWGCGGGARAGKAPSALSRFIVFRAAPFNSIGTLRRTWALLNRNAPPAYVNRSAAKTQPSQPIPSNGWTPPKIPPPWSGGPRGGTTGSAPEMSTFTWPACTRVDVWMSEDAMNAEEAPTINDPNASATLIITPPLKGKSNCVEWVYHQRP